MATGARSGSKDVRFDWACTGFAVFTGKWNGFGGKVEEEETITEGAARELKEEAGIEATDLQKRAVLTFDIATLPRLLEVHVFSASQFKGTPTESEEMRPRWFSTDAIPFGEMWPDDVLWVPLLLDGQSFTGHFAMETDEKTVDHVLRIVPQESLRLCPRCGLPQ